MSMSLENRPRLSPVSSRTGQLGGASLALGGVLFFAGGINHPQSTIDGTKIETLHDMFVQPAWYPSHALLLASFALFATAVLLLRRRDDLEPRTRQTMNLVAVFLVVGALSMAVHMFDALGAESIADGQPALVHEVATWNETIFSTLWGLGIITLAAVGGATRTLGNRITMPLGVAGGVAWCLAAATVAFVDVFDPLFPIAGTLIPVWAIATGVAWASRSEPSAGHQH